MLRSLVGSEMCIRDSVYSSGDEVELFLNGVSLGRKKRAPLTYRFCWDDTCLLYTSDAADDLLCVDIGGRRIIKKKKTETKFKTYIDNYNHNNHYTNYHHMHRTYYTQVYSILQG